MKILNQGTYVQKAESAIKELAKITDKKGKPDMITTSQIRNLLAMTADIYNEVRTSMSETLSEEIKGRINYLKVRFIYEAGRDTKKMKAFVKKAQIIECLDQIGDKKSEYLLFNQYMEALVAYHRFYGGRD